MQLQTADSLGNAKLAQLVALDKVQLPLLVRTKKAPAPVPQKHSTPPQALQTQSDPRQNIACTNVTKQPDIALCQLLLHTTSSTSGLALKSASKKCWKQLHKKQSLRNWLCEICFKQHIDSKHARHRRFTPSTLPEMKSARPTGSLSSPFSNCEQPRADFISDKRICFFTRPKAMQVSCQASTGPKWPCGFHFKQALHPSGRADFCSAFSAG